jgi:small subunit ribosomal protein S16
MLKIRLQRVGRRNDPSFRVIVTEKAKGPKSGKNIETLGWYNPHIDQKQIDTERAKHWIERGAQASGTVYNLLIDAGAISGSKVNVLPQKHATNTGADEESGSEATQTQATAAAEESAGDSQEEAVAADEVQEGEAAAETEAEEDATASSGDEAIESGHTSEETAETEESEEKQ